MHAAVDTVVQVPVHDVADRSYGLHFYAAAVPALVRPHRFRPPPPGRCYEAPLHLSAAQIAQWHALFDAPPEAGIPFTYGNMSATMILLRILADHHLNFRHVRHLRTRLDLPEAPYAPGDGYQLRTRVPLPIRVRDDRIVLETETDLLAADGRRLSRQSDQWMVSRIPPRHLACLAADEARAATCRGITRTAAQLSGPPVARVPIPDDMGGRYGHLSGDLNPTHLSHTGARLFGGSRPFVQGFCTINLLLATAWQLGHRPRHLEVTLVRPVYTGQAIEIRAGDGRIEASDGAGQLVASGQLAGG